MTSTTISGTHTLTQTLSTSATTVYVTGTINAYGSVGVYTVQNNGTLTPETIDAALFGPVGTLFTVNNSGLIESHETASNPFDVGVLLHGTLTNSGTIEAGSGVVMFGTSGTNYLHNTGLINGSVGIGGYFNSLAAGVVNAGTIEGAQGAIELRGTANVTNQSAGVIETSAYQALVLHAGGTVNNAGLITGQDEGVALDNGGFVTNSGHIEATAAPSGTYSNYAAIYLRNGGNIDNGGSGTISGTKAGVWSYGNSSTTYATVTNHGLITASSGTGIYFQSDGVVTNSGTISAPHHGIVIEGAGSITNSGSIGATGTTFVNSSGTHSAFGVGLHGGGTITNQAGGQISGFGGVYIEDTLSGSGYLDNLGSISGSGHPGVVLGVNASLNNSGQITGGPSSAGVYVNGSDSVINQSTGVITGGTGIKIGSSISVLNATVENAGTIAGTGGVAINFAGTSSSNTDLLIVDPGAVFDGVVEAANGQGHLDLASAASAGTISGFGTAFTGFNEISFASGASWDVSGIYTGFDSGQVIDGFAVGDTLVLNGFAANKDSYVSGVGLELSAGNGTITLDIAGNFTTPDFLVAKSSTSTTISLVPCFAAGTRILLRRGEVPVEDLIEEDEVVLHGGGTAPITWIGNRKVSLRRHPQPETVLPVLIEAGAIVDGLPRRDLLVSPDHALYLDGHLIPAKALINGTTIRQLERKTVTYYHVELPAHAVLYAEGVPAESYLETGNRGAFSNGGGATILHPDFAQTRRVQESCAELVEDGPVVEAVRTRILARAGIETIDDPAVRIRYRRDGAAVIESRSAIPGHLTPDPRDRRRLGVKIATLRIGRRLVSIDDPALTEGWHETEQDGRWTDGAAVIPVSLVRGGRVKIRLAGHVQYPIESRKLSSVS